MAGVDAVTGLLNGPRAQGAFLLRSSLTPPWSLHVRDRAPLTVVAVVRGEAWVVPEGGSAITLHGGDVAILRGPDPYTFADDPATAPQAVIHPGQRCTTPDGAELAAMGSLGVRTWGNDPGGATVLLTGTYQELSEICRPLLRSLHRWWSCGTKPGTRRSYRCWPRRSSRTTRARRRSSTGCSTCC